MPFKCTAFDSLFLIVRQRTTLTWDLAPADGAASGRYSAFPDSDGSTEIVRFGALIVHLAVGGRRGAPWRRAQGWWNVEPGRAHASAPGLEDVRASRPASSRSGRPAA